MNSATVHRLEGLEPDNLLAFLALLGLLKALEAQDRNSPTREQPLCPRASWDVEEPPLRAKLWLARPMSRDDLANYAAEGIQALAEAHDFGNRKDLAFSRSESREILANSARIGRQDDRYRADLMAALMSDAALKAERSEDIEPTPLCLLFGQGHQHFLERLSSVPRQPTPPPRGKGRKAVPLTAQECLLETLFEPWHRKDPTPSFRWDPVEDVRYAHMAGDPTDPAFKGGTQHGANRLAAIGLSTLTILPQVRAGRARVAVIGGAFERSGFSFAWPIWRKPASLASIRALLAHPALRRPDELTHLDVEFVMEARRISVGKFMNFCRARPIETWQKSAPGRTP